MSDSVGFMDVVNVLRRGRRVILFTFIGAVVAGVILALVLPVRYEARVTFVPVEMADVRGGLGIGGRLADLADMAGLVGAASNTADKSLAVLTSREFTESFLRVEGALPELFPDLWDASAKKWREAKPSILAMPGAWLDGKLSPQTQSRRREAQANLAGTPSAWEAFRIFDRVRSINRDRRTGIVTLTIRWRDPYTAASWANQMLERANEQIRSRAIEDAERSLRYLTDQLGKTSSIELRDVLFRLSEAEQRKAMLASVRHDYAFEVIDPAVPPEQRVSPRRTALVLGMGILGVFLGAALVIARALLGRGRPATDSFD